jgi:hypothetical protein
VAPAPDTDPDAVAWRVLADLMTPDGAFARLPPDGLEQLIEMRLTQEAQRLGLALPDLVRAFERAIIDLTGHGRVPPDRA